MWQKGTLRKSMSIYKETRATNTSPEKDTLSSEKAELQAKTARAKGQARAIAVEREASESDTDSTDSDYVYAIQQQKATTNGAKKTTLNIHNKQVQFLVYTGATVDHVDSKTYDLLRNKVALNNSNPKIYAYGATKPLQLKGRFQGTIESKTRYTVSQFYVVEGTGGNLLSAKTAQDLGLIKMVNTITQMPPNTKKAIRLLTENNR